VIEYIKKMDELREVRKNAHKEHWKSLSVPRKALYYFLWAGALGILLLGYFTLTIHSSSLITLFLVSIIAPLVKGGPRLKKRMIANIITFPLVPLILSVYVGGSISDTNYDLVWDQQQSVIKYEDKIAIDAKEFRQTYQEKRLEFAESLDLSDSLLYYGKNDYLAYIGLKKLLNVYHHKSPHYVDTTAMLPLPEIVYGDRSIILYAKDIAIRNGEEEITTMENELGKSRDNFTSENFDLHRQEYKGISVLTCTVKDSGEVLLATSMPFGYFLDLKKVPAAAPLVEICQSVAKVDDLKSLTASSAISSQEKRAP